MSFDIHILFYFHESVVVLSNFSSCYLSKNWDFGTAEFRVIAQQVLRRLRQPRGQAWAKKKKTKSKKNFIVEKKTQIICNISLYWKGFSISTFLESCHHWSHIWAAASKADTAGCRSPEEKKHWFDLVQIELENSGKKWVYNFGIFSNKWKSRDHLVVCPKSVGSESGNPIHQVIQLYHR